jgi:branched-chain amino acid transport system permease protein
MKVPVDNLRMAHRSDQHLAPVHADLRVGAGSPGLAARSADLLQSTWLRARQLVFFLIVVAVGGLGSIRGPFIAAC